MPAFNLEYEQTRLQEPGLTRDASIQSAKDSLRTLVAERTNAPSFFGFTARPSLVTSVGYEHRGDLSKSFGKSIEEAGGPISTARSTGDPSRCATRPETRACSFPSRIRSAPLWPRKGLAVASR